MSARRSITDLSPNLGVVTVVVVTFCDVTPTGGESGCQKFHSYFEYNPWLSNIRGIEFCDVRPEGGVGGFQKVHSWLEYKPLRCSVGEQ